MRTLDDVEVDGKRVLVRVDFNVPLDGAVITDDTRIRAALPTLMALRERGARLILVTHLGRPKGEDPSLSTEPMARRLEELIGAPVLRAGSVVGPAVLEQSLQLEPGGILMLENVRYEPGETVNDDTLARSLAELADVYVNDAFGAAHRAHASTEGVTHHVQASAAGLLLQREVQTLNAIFDAPDRPLVAVVGGAKVTDKIDVIDRFLEIADVIAIGGAMCFPFFAAQGHGVGASLCEPEGIEPALRALEAASASGCRLELPVDLVLGERFDAQTTVRELDGIDVPDGWMGLDVGPRTRALYAAEIAGAGSVLWNGPMGAFELAPFAAGTLAVAQAVADAKGVTVVGGGDSVAALVQFGFSDCVTHLSTGGGAFLELLEGKSLPGVEALS
ncbi:MAG: phosphoglycerate kinase [Solirubrobacterales bacterium]|nr:phosphoglycerate kinase [Solirubrobacterales bacterium]